ncbi:MAG: glycoside hydrolase family protein [Asticcacaulis sp.]
MRARHKVSRAGVELIKSFEGLRQKATRLVDGRWSIGYGHTYSAREGANVTAEDADALLRFDLLPVVDGLNNLVHTPINQNQFDALVSFAFNIGIENFVTSDVLRRINEGRITEAAQVMDNWTSAEYNGQTYVLAPLVRRRAAEKTLFLTPDDGGVEIDADMIAPGAIRPSTPAPTAPVSPPVKPVIVRVADIAETPVQDGYAARRQADQDAALQAEYLRLEAQKAADLRQAELRQAELLRAEAQQREEEQRHYEAQRYEQLRLAEENRIRDEVLKREELLRQETLRQAQALAAARIAEEARLEVLRRQEAERIERERLARAEYERLELARLEQQRLEQERLKAEARLRAEQEAQARERQMAEERAAEALRLAQAEEAAAQEAQRLEAERLETERVAAENLAREQAAAEAAQKEEEARKAEAAAALMRLYSPYANMGGTLVKLHNDGAPVPAMTMPAPPLAQPSEPQEPETQEPDSQEPDSQALAFELSAQPLTEMPSATELQADEAVLASEPLASAPVDIPVVPHWRDQLQRPVSDQTAPAPQVTEVPAPERTSLMVDYVPSLSEETDPVFDDDEDWTTEDGRVALSADEARDDGQSVWKMFTSTLLWIISSVVGLAALGGATASYYQSRSDVNIGQGQSEQFTVISSVLAVIGIICVCVSVYLILKRLGGLKD